jgi:hypothetical protein
MAKREPPNLSKPLPNRVVRGLLRALMMINEPPQRRATRLDVPTSTAGVVRYHSPERMRDIAAHLLRLAAAGKIAKLKPATATLVAEALAAYVARPNYDQVLAAVCGSKNCASRPTCFTCRAKTNVLISLFDGRRNVAVGDE